MNGRTWTWRVLAGAAALAGAGSLAAQAPLPVAPKPPPVEAAPAAAPVGAPAAPVAATNGIKPVAVVNGEAISQADLDLAMKQAGPMPVQVPEARRRQMQFELLGLLIDEVLMKQFLAKNAPPVTAGEVEAKLAELAEGLKKSQGKTLADLCRETNQTEAGLRAEIALRTQWQHYANARVTDADVQRYYHEYRDFFDGTTVRASHIVLRVPPTATPSEQAAARAKLAALRDDIAARKVEFADAARMHSQCKSAESGGDIGFFPRKWVVEESFARAAFALMPGQLSDIVQTDYGLHLIKVTERKVGQPSEFAKIKDEVREFYIEDLRQSILAQQRKAAKIEINLP